MVKGRGRPQRILLGVWPEETIKGVVKTVVFRDAKELRDEAGMQLSAFGRHSVAINFIISLQKSLRCCFSVMLNFFVFVSFFLL